MPNVSSRLRRGDPISLDQIIEDDGANKQSDISRIPPPIEEQRAGSQPGCRKTTAGASEPKKHPQQDWQKQKQELD